MAREVSVGRSINREQIITITLMTILVVVGVLTKTERAPANVERVFEMILDPIRIAIPLLLLGIPKLREKIGVTQFFCVLGLICVLFTVASEAFRATAGFWLIVPAYIMYALLLVHASRKVPSPSWAAFAVCLALAPVF